MRRVAALLTVSALALAGCATDDEPDPSGSPSPTDTPTSPSPTATEPTPTEPTPTASPTGVDVAAMEFTACEAQEYTIQYPADWQLNDADELVEACRVFHPDPVDLPEEPQGISLHWAVTVSVEDADYEDITGADPQGEVLAEERVTVDGREAQRIEVRSDGAALVPEGELQYGYTIDLGGRSLVVRTFSVGETDYERDKRVLDRMVTEELTIRDDTEMVDGPSTTERSTQDPDGSVVLTDVDIGAHDSFDRLVFELTGDTRDGEAGWLIEYDEDPRSQGRGDPVDIEGDAVLRVALRQIPYPGDASVEGYDGPERIAPEDTEAIVEVVQDTLYEGYQDFFVGLDEQRPYRVERLDDPQRVVIDIETG